MKLVTIVSQFETLLPELAFELKLIKATADGQDVRQKALDTRHAQQDQRANELAAAEATFAERERLIEAREKSLQGVRQQLAESRAQVKARDEENLKLSKKLEDARSKLGKATERLSKIDALFPQLKEATKESPANVDV